jgi:molecular chaperone DnaK (HSP70)
MKHRVIGIDLGTTYSAVAAWNPDTGTSEIILDENGSRTTASVIGLDPVSRRAIVGEVAKRNGPADPANTVIEIKREMGEVFSADSLRLFNAGQRYQVGQPVRAPFNGEWMLPQEISALTLMRMKAIAEREIGEEIRDAVVTVPAYFLGNQRKATEDAALLAGLYPRQLIPEPTAAAICYGVDTLDPQRHVYLVYDLGGGTFDVSIIQVQEAKVEVVATSGDRRLGGGDFDDLITNWAIAESKLDLANNPFARARIKYDAEQAKIRLGSFASTGLVVTDPKSRQSVTLELTRERFEELIDPLLRRSLSSVVQAINNAAEKGVPREAIDAILLVGGSTKIPKVRSLLLEYFKKDESFVRADANPDLLVARGAAMRAFNFQPSPPPFDIRHKPESTLVNPDAQGAMEITLITEHTLGVGVQEGRFDPLITRGTNIPVSVTKRYTNPEGATIVTAPIYQGEGAYVYENTLIGTLQIGPMQPLPANQHQFDVTFALDQNGILLVTINHVNENKTYTGDFKHETTVGGDKALMTLRERLLAMFQPVPVGGGEGPYPPPPPPGSPYAQAAAAAQSASGQYAPPPPPPGTPAPPAAAQPPASAAHPGTPAAEPQAAPAASPEAAAQSADAATDLPPDLLVELTVEVGEQFRSILRRAKKQLLRRVDKELVKAYNAFALAANARRPEAELTDLSDELEDAYSDARRAS